VGLLNFSISQEYSDYEQVNFEFGNIGKIIDEVAINFNPFN
jgi:hypothetical protein